MPVTGLVPGMAVHYAGCCHPLPGDRIVGIVTTGKGVTIHTRDCPTLESFAATPERFIDVDWDSTACRRRRAKRPGPYRPDQRDRRAMSAISLRQYHQRRRQAGRRRRSICEIVNRQQDFMEILVDVEVRDLRHLVDRHRRPARATSGIKQVERAKG